MHFRNNHRVEAIEEGNYIDMHTDAVAEQYLSDLLEKVLLARLKKAE